MNQSRPKPLPAWKRIPPFLPVRLRARADGWTPLRQAKFIGFLAESGCVASAAAKVGKSRTSAYRLRGRPGAESFAAAWDAACGDLAPARKLTFAELHERAIEGPFVVACRGGRFRGVKRKPSTSAVLRLLAHFGRRSAPAPESAPERPVPTRTFFPVRRNVPAVFFRSLRTSIFNFRQAFAFRLRAGTGAAT